MPDYVVHKVDQLLNGRLRALKGARVGLLGVAYKKNCSDVRESPAIKIIELLLKEGATVSYHDPHVASLWVNGQQFQSDPNLDDFLANQDCAIVVADHDSIDWTRVLDYAAISVDTRNVIGRLNRPSTRSSYSPSWVSRTVS